MSRTTMRRFSSEGNLLDLDFLPWRKVAMKSPGQSQESGTYTAHVGAHELDGGSAGPSPPIREPATPCAEGGGRGLSREHSVSVENLGQLGGAQQGRLGACLLSDSFRAYSDGQLAPAGQPASDRDPGPGSPAACCPPFSLKSQQRHQHRARLSAAKTHLKSLFGQSPHSSNSNLLNVEQKDSATERRSRLFFMRQWSQMGHSRRGKIGRDELEKWAESLNALLATQTGVSVFGAFLRSEFSEENLQFYLACEQYRQSSNNFSLQRRAKDIYATYIEPGAPREVNLDSKTRALTTQLLQAPSHSSLLPAQKRIYSLLDTDCYPRFLQSPVYLSLQREAE
ncbi:uncharacterized protein ACNS7B_013058 isoform 1-T2 [Menidia menidia]